MSKSERKSALFFADDPTKVKEFNEKLSQRIIKEANQTYLATLEKIRALPSDIDPKAPELYDIKAFYESEMTEMIARNFPIKKKIKLSDLMQDKADLESPFRSDGENFLSTPAGVPILEIAFPTPVGDGECDSPTMDYPIDTPLIEGGIGVPIIRRYDKLFARMVQSRTFSTENLEYVIKNPPPFRDSWDKEAPINRTLSFKDTQSFDKFCLRQASYCGSDYGSVSYRYDNGTLSEIIFRYNSPELPKDLSDFHCVISPFMQNYILSSDRYSMAGGMQHYIYTLPNISEAYPQNIHFIGSSYRLRDSALAHVNGLGGDQMLFSVDGSGMVTGNINPANILHETLHWLGADHPHENPDLKEFLADWAEETHDIYPSVMAYTSEIFGKRNLFVEDGTIQGDTRFAYLRPYDVVFLMASMHYRLFARAIYGHSQISPDIASKSKAAMLAASYVDDLYNSSYQTMDNNENKLAAHILKGALGVEIPLIIAQEVIAGIGSYCMKDLRVTAATKENALKAVRYTTNFIVRMLLMGTTPTIISLILHGCDSSLPLIQEKIDKIAKNTGFSETQIAKNFYEVGKYFSDNVPQSIQKELLGIGLLFALNFAQYSTLVQGYGHNYSVFLAGLSPNSMPYESISTRDAVVIAISVVVIASAFKSLLRASKSPCSRNENQAQVSPEESDAEDQQIPNNVLVRGSTANYRQVVPTNRDEDPDLEMALRESVKPQIEEDHKFALAMQESLKENSPLQTLVRAPVVRNNTQGNKGKNAHVRTEYAQVASTNRDEAPDLKKVLRASVRAIEEDRDLAEAIQQSLKKASSQTPSGAPAVRNNTQGNNEGKLPTGLSR